MRIRRSRGHERRERGPVGSVLVACAWSAVAVLVGGAGLFALTSSGTTTSLARMGIAAGILATFCSAVGVLVLPAPFRTALRRWTSATAVPLLVGVLTGLLVALGSGPAAGLLAFVPWLAGAVVGGTFSVLLPDLSRRSLRQRREERRQPWR